MIRPILVTLVVATGLTACGASRSKDATAPYGTEYQERHPIRVGQSEEQFRAIPDNPKGGLSASQKRDLGVFLAKYRSEGNGRLTFAPSTDLAVNRDMQSALSHSGIGSSNIAHASGYGVGSLAYHRTGAYVPHRCGVWPDQLAPTQFNKPGEGPTQWHMNGSYYNYGCATQAVLAAQVADPNDFVRPAPNFPISGARRATAYQKYRDGSDPSTSYRTSTAQSTR